MWDISGKKHEKNNSLISVLNLFNIECIKFIIHVRKCLYATYELEEPFAKAAIEKNFQAAASKKISDIKSCP